MARYYGKTSERGYGAAHQKLRLQLLARWHPGDPCARCGQPLLGPPDRIHLGHTQDRTGYTGLEHSDCNCAEGARRGNQQEPRSLVMLKAGNPVCHGCGQPYHYAARACEMCGAHYHPSYGEQRTCSRPCGRELQQRNRRATGWVPKAERPKLPRKQGPVQSGEREPVNGWPSSKIQHYTCRYCGKPGVAHATSQRREVCPARECQLARLAANNLRTRKGMAKEAADAQAAAIVAGCAPSAYGRWQSSRHW